MKISFAFCLVLLIITVTSEIGTSKIISKRENKEIINENGTKNVEITEIGFLDVYVLNNELNFEVCSMKCTADVIVCFDGVPNSNSFVDECDSKCGFRVFQRPDGNAVYYMIPPNPDYADFDKEETCDIIKMIDKSTVRDTSMSACKPKIAENGLIKLNVLNTSSDCPVIIKNAKLTLDVATTVLPSNNNPNSPSNSDSKKSSSSKSPATNIFGIFGCIFILISICFLHQ